MLNESFYFVYSWPEATVSSKTNGATHANLLHSLLCRQPTSFHFNVVFPQSEEGRPGPILPPHFTCRLNGFAYVRMLSPIIPVNLRVFFRTRPRWPSISKHDRGGYDGLCVPDLPLGLLPLLSSLVKPLLLTLQLENPHTLRTGTGSRIQMPF